MTKDRLKLGIAPLHYEENKRRTKKDFYGFVFSDKLPTEWLRDSFWSNDKIKEYQKKRRESKS